MNLDFKTILITGAGGFVGSNLVQYFANNYKNTHIIALECFKKLDKNNNAIALGDFRNMHLSKNVEIVAIDINDFNALGKIFKRNEIYATFHNAAISDTTCEDDGLIMETNFSSFKELIYLCLTYNSHLIYASSAAVYGGCESACSVGAHEKPLNMYGFSKLCMDNETRRIKNKFIESNLSIVGLRYFNVYGPGEYYKGKTASMILQLGLQALKNKEVKLFEFGEQKRDFVYIKDVVNANVIALKNTFKICGPSQKDFDGLMDEFKELNLSANAKKFVGKFIKKSKLDSQIFENAKDNIINPSGIYNVGSGLSSSYNEIIAILKEVLEIDFKITYIKNPYSFFQKFTLANAGDFVQSYSPQYSLKDGIIDYAKTIKDIYEGSL